MSKYSSERELIMQWYDDYSVLLFKYIAKMIKDVYQAEDLTQETFTKTYEYIISGKDVIYPKTFLFRVAHRLTVDYIRKQKPIHIAKDLFLKDSRPLTESIMEIREDSKELYQAIESLKTSYRQVIILRKIEEFSIKETAVILNWSESKVKSTLFRALNALENKLIIGGYINET